LPAERESAKLRGRFPPSLEASPMLRRRLYSTYARRFLAATLLLALPTAGCALSKPEMWDLNRLRDERAVDIDHRLDQNEPIVRNPF
jgi:hypothetical protein